MAVTQLSIDYDEIRETMATVLHYDRSPASWTTDQIDDGVRLIRAGLRKVYHSHGHRWSFLQPRYDLTTVAPYLTGTVQITAGTVSLSGGSWSGLFSDTEGAQNFWFIVAGARYHISSYVGATSVVLTDSTVTKAAGTSYELRKFRYSLPSNFSGFEGALTFLPGQTDEYHEIIRTSEEQIRKWYQRDYILTSDEPTHFCYYPKTFDDTVGQRWLLELWPEANAALTLTGKMRVDPKDLDSTNKYPLGGDTIAECIMEAILSECEIYMNDEAGLHTQRYPEVLAAAIAQDKMTNSPEYLPPLPVLGDSDYEDEFVRIHRQGVATYTGYSEQFT